MESADDLPPLPENWAELVTIGDMERCPYGPFDYRARAWCIDDDERIKRRVRERLRDRR